jgi:hypothetical protein
MGEILQFPRRQEWGLREEGTPHRWHYWVKWPDASKIPVTLRENGYDPSLVLPPTMEWLELGEVDRIDEEQGVGVALRGAASVVFGRWLAVRPCLLVQCSTRHARGYRCAKRYGFRVDTLVGGLKLRWRGVELEDDVLLQITKKRR